MQNVSVSIDCIKEAHLYINEYYLVHVWLLSKHRPTRLTTDLKSFGEDEESDEDEEETVDEASEHLCPHVTKTQQTGR